MEIMSKLNKTERVKKAIKASLAVNGQSATALAAACGLSRGCLYTRYEKGNWRVNELAAAASFLGWSPEFLTALVSVD